MSKYTVTSTSSDNTITVSAKGHRQHHPEQTELVGTKDRELLCGFAKKEEINGTLYVTLPNGPVLELVGF